MPKRLPPRNSSWVQLTKDFVKEWPEVLEGLHFTNMPVKYLEYVIIRISNNVTIHYNIKRELKRKSQTTIAKFLKTTLEQNYAKIRGINLKFDMPKLKKDVKSKTIAVLEKSFK
jgi:hypothetical protein